MPRTDLCCWPLTEHKFLGVLVKHNALGFKESKHTFTHRTGTAPFRVNDKTFAISN